MNQGLSPSTVPQNFVIHVEVKFDIQLLKKSKYWNMTSLIVYENTMKYIKLILLI
jgi:hypothetical protein